MKTKLIITLLAFTFWSQVFSQKTCDIEFLNLKQTNESEFRFDVRIRNTTPNPTVADPSLTGVGGAFAIDAWQWTVAFNPDILNGGSFAPGYHLFVQPGSSELAAAIQPQDYNFGSDQTVLLNTNDQLNASAVTTVLNHGNWVKIGTFIVKLRNNVVDDGISTFSSAHNFASVLPNMVPPSDARNAVGTCTYNASTKKKIANNGTEATVNLINSLVNRPLYSYCYSGTGNYTDPANWNNNVDPLDPSYQVVPTDVTANVGIGSVNYDEINLVDVAAIGVCSVDNNEAANELTVQNGSTINEANLLLRTNTYNDGGTINNSISTNIATNKVPANEISVLNHQIRVNGTGIATVYNVLGKIVAVQSISVSESKIDMNAAKGIYFVNFISDKNTVVTQKVIL